MNALPIQYSRNVLPIQLQQGLLAILFSYGSENPHPENERVDDIEDMPFMISSVE